MSIESLVGASLKRSYRVFALVAVLVLTLSSAALATSGASPTLPPAISSDRPDYAPGETVVLTGETWQPGESARVQVRAEEGYDWSRDVEMIAAGDGTIRDEFRLPDYYVPRYYVTATGETSGTTVTTFTDGNVRVKSASSTYTFNLTYSKYNTDDCTGTAIESGSQQNVGSTNQTSFAKGAEPDQSIMVTASQTSNLGGEFREFASSHPFTEVLADGRTICIPGFGAGSREYFANYDQPVTSRSPRATTPTPCSSTGTSHTPSA
jgi:hypothetical protein